MFRASTLRKLQVVLSKLMGATCEPRKWPSSFLPWALAQAKLVTAISVVKSDVKMPGTYLVNLLGCFNTVSAEATLAAKKLHTLLRMK